MECVAGAVGAAASAVMTGGPAPGLPMTAPSASYPMFSQNSFRIKKNISMPLFFILFSAI